MPSRGWLFSVVIPAYNAERSVWNTLDSVAAQTMTDYDVVVVDDGSQDGTSKQVQTWAADHPDIDLRFIQQDHGGIGAARNAGVRAATGNYVAFLDSDDIWTERKLEVVGGYLEQQRPVDLVCHDEWLEENGRRRRLRYGPHTTYRQLLFRGNCLSTSATVVSQTKLLEAGGFSEDLRFNGVEDYELWLRLARAGCRISYIHEPLGVYRVHGQGVTSRIEEHCAHYLNVLESHFESWQPQTVYCRYLMRKRRAAVLRGTGRAFLKIGRHREACRWFMKSLLQDPFSGKAWALSTLNLLHIRV